MNTEILNAVEAPTEEQIKERALSNNKEDLMKHCAKKYKKYMDAIDTLNGLLAESFFTHADGKFGDLAQKAVVEVIGMNGVEVCSYMPDISNKYIALLNKVLKKCPFTKEEALEWAKDIPTEPEPPRHGFWERLFG